MMKKLIYLFFTALFILTFVSCKKDKVETREENVITFDDKEYKIFEAYLSEIVLEQGTEDELKFFLFELNGKKNNDTAYVMITVFDTLSNYLGGKYPAFDMSEEDPDRGIIPNAIFFGSGIGFNDIDETFYLTGGEGNVNVFGSGTNYELKMNNISAGDYADMFDTDPQDGDYGYEEAGLISGYYNGRVVRETFVLSLDPNKKADLSEILKRIKK